MFGHHTLSLSKMVATRSRPRLRRIALSVLVMAISAIATAQTNVDAEIAPPENCVWA